nr:hypothetical protein CFP56_41515 [Quercus suber]
MLRLTDSQVWKVKLAELRLLSPGEAGPARVIRDARSRRHTGLHRVHEQMNRHLRVPCHGPDAQRYVVQQFHPEVQLEPRRRRGEEPVMVGFNVERPDRGQELWFQRRRVDDGDEVHAYVSAESVNVCRVSNELCVSPLHNMTGM